MMLFWIGIGLGWGVGLLTAAVFVAIVADSPEEYPSRDPY